MTVRHEEMYLIVTECLSSHIWSLQIGHHLNIDIIHPLWIQAVQFDTPKHAVRLKIKKEKKR